MVSLYAVNIRETNMNLADALATFQFCKKKVTPARLMTKWGEALDAENVLPEYPRPQFMRNSYRNLNGWWEYAITKGLMFPAGYDGRILVPFSPESLLSGAEHILQPDEYLWYRRTFTLEGLGVQYNGHVFLNFGAVDEETDIWVNGSKLCHHAGGYLAFSVDITDAVDLSDLHAVNTVTVCVSDSTDTSWKNRGKQKLIHGGMFYTPQSGIWQTVWLEAVPAIYLRELKITPLFDEKAVIITSFVSAACMVKINMAGMQYSCAANIPYRISLPDMHPWSPEDPYLYDLTVTAAGDTVRSYFAMRKFSTGMDDSGIPRLFLNNEPYFQDGILDQGYWPDGLYTAPSDDAMIYDIASAKAMGFNMIRKHLKIEPMRWYYHCDRLGMIVWQDMINGGGRSITTFLLSLPADLPFVNSHFSDRNHYLFSRRSRRGRAEWLRQCAEAMHQLYNCPCIGEWTAFNEGWGQFDALDVYKRMRSWDSTRIIDHASGWYDQGGGDIKSVHSYFSPLKVVPDDRPFCLTEYGGLSMRVEGHSYSSEVFAYEKHSDSTALQTAFDGLREKIYRLQGDGLAAAVYTQLSDVEEEVNGIFTYDRKVQKLTGPAE